MSRVIETMGQALMLLSTLSACHASSEVVISDAHMTEIRKDNPGMTESCLEKIRYSGAWPARTDQCFAMMPRQRWKGLWRDDLEGQVFCASPAQTCSVQADTWVQFMGKRPTGDAPTYKTYQIEFDGRRTRFRGSHGNGGLPGYFEMDVDHVISITPIGESTP